jgi:hypothetical protein
VEDVTRFVNQSDLVKFARLPVESSQCKLDLELGYRIVSATLPTAPNASPQLP